MTSAVGGWREFHRLCRRSADRICTGSGAGRSLGRHAVPERGRHAGARCIDKAQRALREARHRRRGHRRRQRQHRRLAGDRGGARARASCRCAERGYGSALMGGIAAARGRYVIMGDADDSYDFREIPKFVDAAARGLRPGAGLPPARGRRHGHARARCRSCTAGGATRCSRAMARSWFRAPIHDVYCGCAASRKDVLRSARPALHRDGVRHRDDHQGEPARRATSPRCRSRCTRTGARRTRRTCKTFRDGWRTLRFFLHVQPALAVPRIPACCS